MGIVSKCALLVIGWAVVCLGSCVAIVSVGKFFRSFARWGAFFDSWFRIESWDEPTFLAYAACVATVGLLSSFLIVRCILPQDARLSLNCRIVIWTMAIPMTLVV